MAQQTPLYPQHLQCHARMVDFHGWMLPLHYGSQIEEHHAVRNDAGMFDVSHMTLIDIQGTNARPFLRYLLANDVAKLSTPGKALYSAMLTASGGVIDDLIVYLLTENHFRLVVNSATREKDLAWITRHAQPFAVSLHPRDDLALIAVQGPSAAEKISQVLTAQQCNAISRLTSFSAAWGNDWFIATTGYTGEKGYEIALPAGQAAGLWQQLIAAGVRPCGLGARDTLRLEAGLNLYGQEMDESVSPLATNMGWTIAWQPQERDFIGRAALELQRHQPHDRLIGLIMSEKGVLRSGMEVRFTSSAGEPRQGIITSGSYSPSLGCAIALARVPPDISDKALVLIRQREVVLKVTRPVFWRDGKPVAL